MQAKQAKALESRMRSSAQAIYKRKGKNWQRVKEEGAQLLLHIGTDELSLAGQLADLLEYSEQDKDMWRQKYNDLEGEFEQLNAEMFEATWEEHAEEKQAMQEQPVKLQDENKKIKNDTEGEVRVLEEYIRKLEAAEKAKACRGKRIDELSSRQKLRKLDQVKRRGKAALWFVETFGLHIQSLNMTTNEGKRIHWACKTKVHNQRRQSTTTKTTSFLRKTKNRSRKCCFCWTSSTSAMKSITNSPKSVRVCRKAT